MKIKCEYCDSMFDDILENCPNCGATNLNVRRSTSDQPITIEGLKEWYDSKSLPPEDVTRFFIGKDYRGPKAFGIYKEEGSGAFIVYKNKADGSRAVRYRGTDEAFAVNELYTRLKQEILEQKSRSVKKAAAPIRTAPVQSRPKKKSFPVAGIAILVFVFLGMFGLAVDGQGKKASAEGYYRCDDDRDYKGLLFYHYGYNEYGWAVYNEDTGEWEETFDYPSEKFSYEEDAEEYFLSEEYRRRYGGSDFLESTFYDDFCHEFQVSTGYYSYEDQVYYHLLSDHECGWYVYDPDDDDWEELYDSDIPADLTHSSVAEDFWYTPDWDSETQISDFEESDAYSEYQEEFTREAETQSYDDDDDDYYYDNDDDDDYTWDSDDSWDYDDSDWDSDW